jgi:flagellar FliJ protein
MSRSWLDNLLRARQAQEDIAKGAVVRARRDADAAAEHANRYEVALGARHVPQHAFAGSYAATLAARHVMAAALSAAVAVAGEAEAVVRERMGDLTDAATRRRAVEKLAERQAEADRRAEEAAERREVDDLTSSASPRIRRGTD